MRNMLLLMLCGIMVWSMSGCSSDNSSPGDPGRGVFKVTSGQLNYQPWAAAAALLKDGTLLVTGGHDNDYTKKAFIVNPAGNSVTEVGTMNSVRAFHAATTLADGTVLITGGVSTGAILATAELYDPVTRTFRLLPAAMTEGRSDHTATLLPDGRVLLVGGSNMADPTTQVFLDSAEIYDPKTGQFTRTVNKTNSIRIGHCTVLLQDGTVLVAGGGTDKTGTGTKSADIFDPKTNSFTATSEMNITRWSGAAVLLADGRVLFAGGHDSNSKGKSGYYVTATSEIYDPKTGLFTPGSDLGTPRLRHLMFPLPNGDALVAGGSTTSYGTSYILSTEIYRVSTGLFEPGPQMLMGRDYFVGALLADNRILIAGSSSVIESYNPVSNSFSSLGGMAQSRGGHSTTLLADGRVLIAGGVDATFSVLDSAELFDPKSGLSRKLKGTMNEARSMHSADLLPNGKVLIAGGGSNTGELFDPATETFLPVATTLTVALSGHTSTRLRDGRVLLAGGYNAGSSDGETLAIATVYDPASNSFTLSGSMNSPRKLHSAALLTDGRVLVVGGKDAADYDSAELYDPASGVWSLTAGRLGQARSAASATRLSSGKILVIGGKQGIGLDTVALNSAELFDPSSGTFTTLAATLPSASYGHSATMLKDGRILIVGGAVGSQIFDQATSLFVKGADPIAPRQGPPVTLLMDGTVMASGAKDLNYSGITSSMELFHPDL